MQKKIADIKTGGNVRKEYGSLEELTASIKEHGVLVPLLVTKDNVLIAGHRRLKAAKAAGLKTVPVHMIECDSDAQLVENIQRKELTPIEEAQAYKIMRDKQKLSLETIAETISKQKVYVERRLVLLDLEPTVQKALNEGKIRLGHALILARLKDKNQQKKMLREIKDSDRSVSETVRIIRYGHAGSRKLADAKFDKTECKGCKYNGGEQSILFETGAELKGHCLDPHCYHRKTEAWKAERRKKLQAKGTKVLSKKMVDSLQTKERVSPYEDDYKNIKANLHKEPENYAVVFDEDYTGELCEHIYCLNPTARRKKKGSGKSTKNREKEAAQAAKDKLDRGVDTYIEQFLIRKSKELANPCSFVTKALTLWVLLDRAESSWHCHDRIDESGEILNRLGLTEPGIVEIMKLKVKDIDNAIKDLALLWLRDVDNLPAAAESFGVDVAKHFELTEDYCNLYRNDQLDDLADELGVQLFNNKKKSDKVRCIVSSAKPGKLPKIVKKYIPRR